MSEQRPGGEPEALPGAQKAPMHVRAKETANTGYLALRWAVILILAVVALAFIVRNFEDVEVDWVFGKTTAPLSAIMIAFLAIGFVIGWLVHWAAHRNRRNS